MRWVLSLLSLYLAISANAEDNLSASPIRRLQNLMNNNKSTTTNEMKQMAAAGTGVGNAVAALNKEGFRVSGGLEVYPGEVWATTSDGIGTVGHVGGGQTLFMLHSQFAAVTRVNVWWCDSWPRIRTLEVFFDDGTSQMTGDDRKPCNLQSVDIAPGELLLNNAYITGNGLGEWTGAFGFKTTKQSFDFGDPKSRYNFNVDQSQLLGFVGYQCPSCFDGEGGIRNGVYALGYLIGKPIAKAELTDITYDKTFFEQSPGMPKSLARTTFCNNDAGPAQHSVSTTVASSSSHCWASSTAWNVGVTVSLSGTVMIPAVSVTESGAVHWGLTESSTSDLCTSDTETESKSDIFTIDPYDSCTISITQWQAPISDLKYTANLKITYKDGSVVLRPVQKTYNGVYVSEEQVSRNCKQIKTCPLVSPNVCTVTWERVQNDIMDRCGVAGFETIAPIMAANFCAQFNGEGSGTFFGQCPDVKTSQILMVQGEAMQAEGGGPDEYRAMSVLITG